jgi:hypothetical protein
MLKHSKGCPTEDPGISDANLILRQQTLQEEERTSKNIGVTMRNFFGEE